jgi:putative transcriptional regulator
MPFDYFKYKNKLKPEKGRLLISEPFLPDPNFERTIVLLCEHNEEGSFGFVLNKPSIAKVSEIVNDIPVQKEAFVGGPVQQDTLHFLHRISDLQEAVPICDNIFWGGNVDDLVQGLSMNTISDNDIRFFLGYSGWSSGQLDQELEQDSWIVCDYVTPELLFDTPPGVMWRQALSNMGGRFSVYSNYPVDPSLN